MKKIKQQLLAISGAVALLGIGSMGMYTLAQELESTTLTQTQSSTTTTMATTTTNETVQTSDEVTAYFSDGDLNSDYDDTTATTIALNGTTANVTGTGATITDSGVTITQAGTYILSGSSEGIQIHVNAGENDKVQLILNNVTMTNVEPVIYIENGDKVYITSSAGTVNTIEDGNTRADTSLDAAIFSKSDLTLNGEGTLRVTGNYANAIESNDDLKIAQTGTYTVTAVNNGLSANDALNIIDATVAITAGKDGLHVSNDADTTLGNSYLAPNHLTITASEDGIDASNELIVAAGTIQVLKSTEGLEAKVITINDGDINIVSTDDAINASSGSSSTTMDPRAIESDVSLTINGGTVVIDSEGDGLDSNGTLTIAGGMIFVNGPTRGGNSSIDSAASSIIGGQLISLGTSDMIEGFNEDSTQASIIAVVNGQAGDNIAIIDNEGNVVLEYTALKSFQSVIASASSMNTNEEYTVQINGNNAGSYTASLALMSGGMMQPTSGGMMQPMGGFPR